MIDVIYALCCCCVLGVSVGALLLAMCGRRS
jgi:hypothetical protein